VRNLVLARVGASSLHPSWIDPGTDRDWDLRIVPYQPVPEHPGVDSHEIVPGPKWAGLRAALKSWDGWRDYDYVWMPDDDIATTQADITRMFELGDTLGFDLFAPALDSTSYFAHFDTMHNPRFAARRGGFVEIMVPAFSRRALELVVPTLDETDTGWGWGLDSVWPKLLNYENVGILDAVPVTHTRPVGVMYDEELRRRVHEESDALLERYDCEQVHATFGAFDEQLQPVEMAPEVLLAELVKGAQPLIDADPRVLAWIMEFQRPHFQWPEYPVAGTP